MLLKKLKDKISVGLDIGSAQIKAVKLKLSKGVFSLAGSLARESQPDFAGALGAIKDFIGDGLVSVGFSGPNTVIRYVNFPVMAKNELAASLKFEAQKYIPFSVDEVNLDAHILKQGLPDNKMLVLIAAVKKELLTQRLKPLEDAGIKIKAASLDSLALANAFELYPKEEKQAGLKNTAVALVNVGASLANLNILEDAQSYLSRDIHLEGDYSNLVEALRTSFDYYDSQGSSSVGKIFLSGGAARDAGLKEALGSLGIALESWQAFGLSGEFNVAVGLALQL